MKVDGNKITFSKELDAKYSGNVVEETDTEITLEGEDEESYVKVYSPFRGVAQLMMFENGRWSDANKSGGGLDFSSMGLGGMEGLGGLEGLGGMEGLGDLSALAPEGEGGDDVLGASESDDDQSVPLPANEEIEDAEIVEEIKAEEIKTDESK